MVHDHQRDAVLPLLSAVGPRRYHSPRTSSGSVQTCSCKWTGICPARSQPHSSPPTGTAWNRSSCPTASARCSRRNPVVRNRTGCSRGGNAREARSSAAAVPAPRSACDAPTRSWCDGVGARPAYAGRRGCTPSGCTQHPDAASASSDSQPLESGQPRQPRTGSAAASRTALELAVTADARCTCGMRRSSSGNRQPWSHREIGERGARSSRVQGDRPNGGRLRAASKRRR